MIQALRANALAASALTMALIGTSIAIVGLPHNSVGGKQIRKGAVHKSDLHKHAVSAAKIGTGVLRIDGFASSQFTGAFPPLHPETVLTSIHITTTTTGRIFGFGRGNYHVNCQMVSVVQAGMFVDGIPLVASGSALPSDGSDAELNLFGATAAPVAAGAHTLTIQADCPNGDVDSTAASGDVALGAIVIRN